MSVEVEQPPSKKQKQHIAWRRERVAELSAQGRSEREVSTILKVSLGTVSNDISYLNKQACDGLHLHLQKRLPTQYRECQNGLNQVKKMAWNMILTDSIDYKKIHALSLLSDCYIRQMDLSTNAGTIEEAIHFVNQKTEQLNTMHKQEDDNGNGKIEPTKEGSQKTTNTVF